MGLYGKLVEKGVRMFERAVLWLIVAAFLVGAVAMAMIWWLSA